MDYGGVEKRRTKGDLKRKRKNRVYKRGGQFRAHEVSEDKKQVGDKKERLIRGRKKKK